MAKRSSPLEGRNASAPSSACAWGVGMRLSEPRAGRSSSNSPPNGIWASDWTPRARRRLIPPARSSAYVSSADLPMPASPTTARTSPRPGPCGRDVLPSTTDCSRSRPTSTARSVWPHPVRTPWNEAAELQELGGPPDAMGPAHGLIFRNCADRSIAQSSVPGRQ